MSQGVCPREVSCSQQVLHSLLQASKHLVLGAWPLTAPLPIAAKSSVWESQECAGLQLENGNKRRSQSQNTRKSLVDVDHQVLFIFIQLRTPWSNEREYLTILWIWPLLLTLPSQQAITFYKARLIRSPQRASAQAQTMVSLWYSTWNTF